MRDRRTVGDALQGIHQRRTERFHAYRIPTTDALVRQLVEVGGVIWGAESATEKLIAFRTPV